MRSKYNRAQPVESKLAWYLSKHGGLALSPNGVYGVLERAGLIRRRCKLDRPPRAAPVREPGELVQVDLKEPPRAAPGGVQTLPPSLQSRTSQRRTQLQNIPSQLRSFSLTVTYVLTHYNARLDTQQEIC